MRIWRSGRLSLRPLQFHCIMLCVWWAILRVWRGYGGVFLAVSPPSARIKVLFLISEW
jgi:hypothetical protein